jgi:hypothetical protein
MSRLVCAATLVTLTLAAGTAFADPDVTVTDPTHARDTGDPKGTYERGDIEAGVFGGGFISNYYHQFYDDSVFDANEGGANPRPDLDRLSPELGGRFAYFFRSWFGLESEASTTFIHTKGTDDYAQLFGFGIQAIFQRPMGAWTPYIAIGDGLRHVSSPNGILGSDTDWPINGDIGLRYWLTSTLAVRADFRYMRGPSEGHDRPSQIPVMDPSYTLNAGYAEFSLGLSIKPRD